MKVYSSLILLLCYCAITLAQSDGTILDHSKEISFRDDHDNGNQVVNLIFPKNKSYISPNLGFGVKSTGNNFEIAIKSNANELLYWRLFDINGRFSRQGKESLSEGENDFSIENTFLPRGIYIIEIRLRDKLFHKKIMLW